jgi:hypothetical protein
MAIFVNSRFFMMSPQLVIVKFQWVRKVLHDASSRCTFYAHFSDGGA